MRRLITRRLVYIALFSLALLFVAYTLPSIGEMRSLLVREYFEHKEFLFNLKTAGLSPKAVADEATLRELFRKLNIEPESLYTGDSGIEVSLRELSWRKIPLLIKAIEDRFTLVSFSAVDNTGKGVFEVRLVVR